MFIPKRFSVGLLAIAMLIGLACEVVAQNCKTCEKAPLASASRYNTQPLASASRYNTQRQQVASPKKMEGWAKVPGGTVWLEPGRQAYEHDTGLVRDLVTGQKSMPITPQSYQHVYQQPVYQPAYQPQPLVFQVPQPLQPLAPMPFVPSYQPAPYVMPYRNPHYDVGPYGRYDSGRGAISSGRGAIAGQWQQVGRLPR